MKTSLLVYKAFGEGAKAVKATSEKMEYPAR